jgi:hypothetical protein
MFTNAGKRLFSFPAGLYSGGDLSAIDLANAILHFHSTICNIHECKPRIGWPSGQTACKQLKRALRRPDRLLTASTVMQIHLII